MAERGMVVAARTLFHCCFENAFWIGALLKDGNRFIGFCNSPRDWIFPAPMLQRASRRTSTPRTSYGEKSCRRK
jgi:hypothetical protein